MGMGWEDKVKIDTTVMAAVSCGFGKKATILERQGLRGERSHNVADTRNGPYSVAGPITFEPSPSEFTTLIEWALGTADVLASKAVSIDKGHAAYDYADVYVNSITITGSEGGIIRVVAELLGTTEAAGSAISAAVTSTAPFVFSDCTLTLAGTARKVKSFELKIDNMLTSDAYRNSVTLAAANIQSQDKLVTLTVVVDESDANEDLYDTGVTGVTGSLAISDGTSSATFTFGKLQCPAEQPEITGKGEQFYTLNYTARKTGSTADIAYSATTGS